MGMRNRPKNVTTEEIEVIAKERMGETDEPPMRPTTQ